MCVITVRSQRDCASAHRVYFQPHVYGPLTIKTQKDSCTQLLQHKQTTSMSAKTPTLCLAVNSEGLFHLEYNFQSVSEIPWRLQLCSVCPRGSYSSRAGDSLRPCFLQNGEGNSSQPLRPGDSDQQPPALPEARTLPVLCMKRGRQQLPALIPNPGGSRSDTSGVAAFPLKNIYHPEVVL